jgi:hypothetical protein
LLVGINTRWRVGWLLVALVLVALLVLPLECGPFR